MVIAEVVAYWPGGSKFLADARSLFRDRDDAMRVGALYGFLPFPAVVKDCVATLVLCLAPLQVLVMRLPAAVLQATALAYMNPLQSC